MNVERADRKDKVLIALGATTVATGLLLTFCAHRAFGCKAFGWGVHNRFLPGRACRFVDGAGLKGLTFNDFDLGGYLMRRWLPGRRFFQDGRVQSYPPEFLQRDVADLDPGETSSWRRLDPNDPRWEQVRSAP
jgi:hypothetical protein